MPKKKSKKRPRADTSSEPPAVAAAAWAVDTEPDVNSRRRKRVASPDLSSKKPAVTGAAARKRAKHGLCPGGKLRSLKYFNSSIVEAWVRSLSAGVLVGQEKG